MTGTVTAEDLKEKPAEKPPCPTCSMPLDLQSRELQTWWYGMCRKWFDEQLERM
jgi:hypothetical protein